MGKLLDVCSRFQRYFAAGYIRGKKPEIKPKKGAIILVGGGDGSPKKAYETLHTILHHINVTEVYNLAGSFNTNVTLAQEDKKAINDINDIALFLNGKGNNQI